MQSFLLLSPHTCFLRPPSEMRYYPFPWAKHTMIYRAKVNIYWVILPSFLSSTSGASYVNKLLTEKDVLGYFILFFLSANHVPK